MVHGATGAVLFGVQTNDRFSSTLRRTLTAEWRSSLPPEEAMAPLPSARSLGALFPETANPATGRIRFEYMLIAKYAGFIDRLQTPTWTAHPTLCGAA